MEKLRYIAHLDNPAIDNVVKGGKIDDLALQKYLLAMGLMQDTIQQNLNLIVTDGGFNEASILKVLDTKYPSVMKKSNPIDVVFKDKVKFDAQTPVIGTLLAQVNNEDKKKEKAFLNQLSGAPSITDLNIRKQLQELNDFNKGQVNNDDDDNDDNNDGGIDLPPPPTAP